MSGNDETVARLTAFCSFYPFGAIRGVPLLRLTALVATFLLATGDIAF